MGRGARIGVTVGESRGSTPEPQAPGGDGESLPGPIRTRRRGELVEFDLSDWPSEEGAVEPSGPWDSSAIDAARAWRPSSAELDALRGLRTRHSDHLTQAPASAPGQLGFTPVGMALAGVFPYRCMCYLQFPAGTGTGCLVGPRHVLTAAHNIGDQTLHPSQIQAVRFAPWAEPIWGSSVYMSGSLAPDIVGFPGIEAICIAGGYTGYEWWDWDASDDATKAHDYAVIVLRQPPDLVQVASRILQITQVFPSLIPVLGKLGLPLDAKDGSGTTFGWLGTALFWKKWLNKSVFSDVGLQYFADGPEDLDTAPDTARNKGISFGALNNLLASNNSSALSYRNGILIDDIVNTEGWGGSQGRVMQAKKVTLSGGMSGGPLYASMQTHDVDPNKPKKGWPYVFGVNASQAGKFAGGPAMVNLVKAVRMQYP